MRITDVEEKLILEAVYLRYGYDFRDYSRTSLRRRLEQFMMRQNVADPIHMIRKLLDDREYFQLFFQSISVHTSELFRDPSFFRAFRERVVPFLKTYPSVNIWLAGVSTGEEFYSLAILLREEGLLERCQIYATDISPAALKSAEQGIYSIETLQSFAKNYTEAGGSRSPSDYYTADYGLARFDASLRNHAVFSAHNLVSDSVFVECQVVLCRNVLIYFNRQLQERVLRLFASSLSNLGFLGLGSKETLRFSRSNKFFLNLDEPQRWYQRSQQRLEPDEIRNLSINHGGTL